MATYKFNKYKTWDGYSYFAISEKTIFGWKERKTFKLGYELFGDFTKEDEDRQYKRMMESVDRLVKAGHTVI
jgi:predicted kinase